MKNKEFNDIIKEFLVNKEYQKLDNFSQHAGVSRLEHSINVAYYTYKLSKKLKLDYISATRAAMLHDFFLYNWQEEKHTIKEHIDLHPKNALINSKKHFQINYIIEDCILNHMWPAGANKPKTKEGQVLQLADKLSASLEVSKQSYKYIKLKTMDLLDYITK